MSINEEEAHLSNILDTTCHTNPVLAAYISSIFQYHINMNAHLCEKLTWLAKQGHYVAQHREGTLLPSFHPNSTSIATSFHDANKLVGDVPQLGNSSNNEPEDGFQELQTQDLEDNNDNELVENEDYLKIIGRVASALETMDLNLM